MKPWLKKMVDEVERETYRANPPVEETPALRLQRLIMDAGRENQVSEGDMAEALAELGITDDEDQAEAMEQFASWL